MPFMPVQIFIQAAKMEEEIFNLSKTIFLCPQITQMKQIL